MKRKPLKQHVFNSETGLCIYCGADAQESHSLCGKSPKVRTRQSIGEESLDSDANDLAIAVSVPKSRYDGLPSVDIIASGYEFDCPSCLTYNTLIDIPKYGTAVECHHCHDRFRVDEANHAQE